MRNYLRSCLFLLSLAFLTHAGGAADPKLEPDFVRIFNGRDLTGWSYSDTDKFDGKTKSSDGRFSVGNGVLLVHAREPRANKKIWTVQKFPRDFVLRFDFRAAVGADSGVYLRRPQVQIRDYLRAGPYKDLKQYRPQEWNAVEVVVKDDVAVTTCNGEILGKPMKLPEDGPIGFEADLGQMEYRNIRIKETP